MLNRNYTRRSGFTLIEMLIVVAIILFLLSIVGVATMRFISSAKVTATKALLTKIQRQLQARIEAIHRDDLYLNQQNYQGGVFIEGAAVDGAARRTDVSPSRPNVLKRYTQIRNTLAKKSLQRQFLPQTWAEAAYLLGRAGKAAPSSPQPATESAEVLFFFLSDGSVKGYSPATQDVFGGNEIKDTDGNGFPELVDAWGKPLRFFRWPTRLLRPDGLTTVQGVDSIALSRASILITGLPSTLTLNATSNHDPDDSYNVLTPATGGWCLPGEQTSFENGGAGIFVPRLFPMHTLFTWHAPLVVSAGLDGDFGIYGTDVPGHIGRLCEPILPAPSSPDFQFPPALTDNITTLNIKSGGN